MRLQEIVAIGGARTPLGKYGGAFRDIPNYKLGAHAIEGALQRANLPPALVQNVILGCCRQAGSGVNPARTAALLAGISQETPAVTVNMACASGMLAVIQTIQAILSGDFSLAVAGGMDSMSSMPHLIRNYRWQTDRNAPQKIEDSWSDAIDPLIGKTLGFVAEKLADKYHLTRADLDAYALESHQKALHHRSARAEEIVPIEIVSQDSRTQTVIEDECPRADTSLEKLAALTPAFKEDGLLTAGNSCCMADGAVALIFTTRERASKLGVRPMFSILSYASIGCAPEWFGEGPALALRHALDKAKLDFKQLDCLEINEGFATQALANEKMLHWDRSKVNVHGGAIALGHPSGMSGARIILSLYHALRSQGKEIGGAAITGAGGVATALIIKHES